jgi:nucleotidyltransferase/DNA polymerase involved in DNA repair
LIRRRRIEREELSTVVPNRPTQSISSEDTFERDVPLAETEPMIRRLAEHTWAAYRKESRAARTVGLKLKTSGFQILTRSLTPPSPPSTCEELTTIALSLRERVGLGAEQRFRLVGVGLSNFFVPETVSTGPASLRVTSLQRPRLVRCQSIRQRPRGTGTQTSFFAGVSLTWW